MTQTLKLIFLFTLFTVTTFAAEYRITNYGAVANDGQSDTVAIRNALKAAEQNCGGTVIIPAGEFLLTDAVYTTHYGNDACGYIPTTIRGEDGSIIRVSVGSWNYGLVITYRTQAKLENLTFIGKDVPSTHPDFTDANHLIYLAGNEHTIIERCNFYNLAVASSIIRVASTKLEINHCQFNGNTAYYSSNWTEGGAYILGDNDGYGNAWTSITIRNSNFLDYVNFRQQWLTKTSAHLTGAYIRTKLPHPAHANAMGKLTVIDSVFDEGAHTAIAAYNTPSVELKGIGVNLNSSQGATGVRLTNVRYASITQNVADWSTVGRPYLTTQNVKFVKISDLDLRAGNKFWHNLGNTNMNIEYCEECATKPYIP